MPRVEATLLAAHIRRIAPPGAEALTDADLVGRYAGHRDAAAFEVLVWRHGPMVWATCRRVLRHQQDVEDAFQATFLALARSAKSIATQQAVAGWLHRVTMNAALKLKANRRTTGLTADVPDRPEPDAGELAGAVDEELERLPDRMRAAFVLCGLEGMTGAEAARELGCPVGTVDSRLHAARARLRDRLARRGFGPGVLSGLVLAAAPAVAVAGAIGVGNGVSPGPAVDALATQAARAMTNGVRTMKAVAVALAVTFAGAVWAFGGSRHGPAPVPPTGAVPAAPGGPGEGRIALWRDGHPIALTPGEKGTTSLGTGFEGNRGSIRLGPNGKLLVYVANRMTVRPADPEKRDRMYVRDGTRTTEVTAVASPCHAFWGADGTVYGYGFEAPKRGDPEPPPDLTTDLLNWSFDPRTGKAKVLKLPRNVSVLDVSPDGKTFLVLQYEKPRGVPGDYRLGLIAPGGGEPLVPLTKLGESMPGDFRFSPDGRRALGSVYREEDQRLVPDLFVFDLAAGIRNVVTVPKDARVLASCWSPDGKRIAYAWETKAAAGERNRDRDGPVVPGRERKPIVTITVARPDGSDAKDVYTETEYWFGSIDWGDTVAGHPPGAAAAPGGPQVVRPLQPAGVLGERLGEYHTIEGVKPVGGKFETGTLLVDTVDGKKLDQPIALPVRGSNARGLPFDLPANMRCVLKGYELGEMIGRPPAEYSLAKERGQDPEELAKRDATPWHWRPYFVALVIVEPKGLEVPKR